MKKIELKELSLNDGTDIFEMIQQFPIEENGFWNPISGLDPQDFRKGLEANYKSALGIELPEGHVPQTVYWLFVNRKPVGIGKLRHYLTDSLLVDGGHIGYGIKPSERGKGYGKIILRELLKKAGERGINRVLVTCGIDNTASEKVILANQGVLQDKRDDKCRYWIELWP